MHCLALVSAVDPLLVDLTALALHGEEALALTASLHDDGAPAAGGPSAPGAEDGFIRLPAADYSVLRVAERVKQGGHNIPEATIRRRFATGLANLDAYCAAVNHWAVYENTADCPALLAWGENHHRCTGDIAQAQNAELRASAAAMQRAARAARQLALQTDTAIIQTRDGKPLRLDAAALRQQTGNS